MVIISYQASLLRLGNDSGLFTAKNRPLVLNCGLPGMLLDKTRKPYSAP